VCSSDLTAYGIFNTVYGVSFLFGSAVMGFLYDKAPGAIGGFVVLLEVVSVPILFAVLKELRHR
jgi:predicted MFS family arabinose efflux permease